MFLKNGYPLKLIDACIQRFLNKMFVKKAIVDTVPQREYSIVLPYLGPLSDRVQKRIKNVFQKLIPVGKISIIFGTQRRISHFLKFKDVIPHDYDSHIIYQFKCPCCIAGYIGETRVYHKVRNSQHLGISEFTGNPINSGVPTAVTKHIKDKKCVCSYKDFSIIGRESDYFKRLTKESIFIKLFDYELNGQQTSTKLYLF